MRIATWNVNSLRARSEQVMAWLVERKIDNHWDGVAIISRVGLENVAHGFQSSTEFD